MGFWSFLRRERAPSEEPSSAPDDAPPPAPAPFASERVEPAETDHVAALARFGAPGGPSLDAALALLAASRTTPSEALAIDALVRAHTLAQPPLPEPLLLAVATALSDRGEPARAAQLLERADSPVALLLRADLFAAQGDLPAAIAQIERALSRDLDLPGARERRAEWRARLGLSDARRATDADLQTRTVAASTGRAPFELLREVARGGAGTVFLARDVELDRPVAVKLYHDPTRARPQLLHEARVAARLDGPGIVRVLDVDPDRGWIALAWAEHGSLRASLHGGVPPALAPLERLDAWVPSLVRALARVHAAGWVHHDVKPANVLLASVGDGVTPWLADFGSARERGAPSPPGSLGYVSPERLAGRASDPRDDLYGLGRVIEEALRAFGGSNDAARWREVAGACVGPSSGRPADAGELLARLAASPPT